MTQLELDCREDHVKFDELVRPKNITDRDEIKLKLYSAYIEMRKSI